MRSLLRQTAAFVLAFVAALGLLASAAAFTQAALERSHSVPAQRIASLAASFLFPSVLVALVVAALFARTRGSSLLMAALAAAALFAGRRVLERPAAAPAAVAVESVLAPGELLPLEAPGAWIRAGRIRDGRLFDVLVIAAAAAAPPRLAYAAEVRPTADLRVGGWQLRREPVRLTLLAADEAIQSLSADLSALEARTAGASRGGEPAAALAGALLVFAGTAVIVRRSRWPFLGWTLGLALARGVLLSYRGAFDAQGQALLERVFGSAAAAAPTPALCALGLALVAADLLPSSEPARGRRRRLV